MCESSEEAGSVVSQQPGDRHAARHDGERLLRASRADGSLRCAGGRGT